MPGALMAVYGNAGGGLSASLTRATLSGTIRYFTALTDAGAPIPPTTCQTALNSTCNAINGLPPYSYAWTFVSGDSDIYIVPFGPTTAGFAATFNETGSKSAVFKCIVTDAAATVVDSNNVFITLGIT